MTTAIPIPQVTQLFTGSEITELRGRDAVQMEDFVLPDAEEEEMAELWESDRGNQGA